MKTKVLNYRIIVSPDKQTGTEKLGFTALCPTLGVADDGKTIDEALINVQKAIKAYMATVNLKKDKNFVILTFEFHR